MSLTIDVSEHKPGEWEVVLAGSLDSDTAPDLEQALESVVTPAAQQITFNMSDVTFISSAGIRVVAVTSKSMKSHGGALAVTNLQPQIQRIFDIIKALPNLGVFASRAEADEYFAEMQRQVLEEGK